MSLNFDIQFTIKASKTILDVFIFFSLTKRDKHKEILLSRYRAVTTPILYYASTYCKTINNTKLRIATKYTFDTSIISTPAWRNYKTILLYPQERHSCTIKQNMKRMHCHSYYIPEHWKINKQLQATEHSIKTLEASLLPSHCRNIAQLHSFYPCEYETLYV